MPDSNQPPQDPNGQDPNGEQPFDPAAPPPSGEPYPQPGYGSPYGQPSYGQDPYGPPPGQAPPGQGPYGQTPYAQTGAAYSPTESFGWAWNQFTSNVALFLVLGLLMMVPSGIVQGWVNWDGRDNADAALFAIALAPLQLALGIVGALVSFLFSVVAARAAVVAARGQRPTLGDAFEGVNWTQAVIAGLLTACALQVGAMLCILPGIVAAFLLVFTASAVALRPEADGIAALTSSFRTVSANAGSTLLLFVLAAVAFLAGLLACCVGLVVAVPVVQFALTHAFLRLTGEPTAA